MQLIKIVLGVLALGLAWAVLFRTGLIFKLNTWMRDNVFNDRLILFSGRRVAVLLLVLGGVALFSGVEDIIEVPPIKSNIAAKMLEDARQDFREARYLEVVRRCKELVRADPKNIEAWELLATGWWALGEKEQAKKAVEVILRIDPENALGNSSIMKSQDKMK
jgi:cytochrome c-type biogenesis protein CcmH/NrfG